MQTLSCDLWLMEKNALRNLQRTDLSVLAAAVESNRENARAVSSATPKRQKAIGIIPVHGILEARPSYVGELLGMTSYERIGAVLDVLLADDSVSHIIFDIASPGGMVYGAQELADKIFNARGRKPMISVANPLSASGAYWIGTAADRLVVTPSGDVGSVGVIAEHVDISQALERNGEKVTTIRSTLSPFKGEGSDVEPLTEEAKANMLARADAIYGRFSSDLARFRGVSVDVVNSQFGQGRVVDSKRALAAGMVDRIDTLQGVVNKLMEGRIRLGGSAVQDQWDMPTIRQRRLEKVAAINTIVGETNVEA